MTEEVSPRPTTHVDTWGFALRDPTTGTYVGRPGPFGRRRVVAALRLGEWNNEWQPLKNPNIVVDTWGFMLRDPTNQTYVGREGVYVNRILSAPLTENTRIFGG
jgi:hypothetical protein